jgi:hypothetical protein
VFFTATAQRTQRERNEIQMRHDRTDATTTIEKRCGTVASVAPLRFIRHTAIHLPRPFTPKQQQIPRYRASLHSLNHPGKKHKTTFP